MKSLLKFTPLLLAGVTVSSDGNIVFSQTGDVAPLGSVMVNLGSSVLNIGLQYLPYLVVFGVVVGLAIFGFNKLSHR